MPSGVATRHAPPLREALYERARRVDVEALREREYPRVQRAPLALDSIEPRLLISEPSPELIAQHDEVMIVAEQLTELLRGLAVRADHRREDLAEERELVLQILTALSQRVERLGV